MRLNHRAMTLVELIVVLAIMLIVLSLVLPAAAKIWHMVWDIKSQVQGNKPSGH